MRSIKDAIYTEYVLISRQPIFFISRMARELPIIPLEKKSDRLVIVS